MMTVLLFIFVLFFRSVYSDVDDYYSKYRRLMYNEDSLKYSLYPPLPDNIYNSGEGLYKGEFEWLARIVPTPTAEFPTLCTCACVSKRVFVSSARCVIGLTVGYISIRYDLVEVGGKAYQVLVTAIIAPKPSEATKQYHEDAGLLVTEDHGLDIWYTASLFPQKRTDNLFNWLDKTTLEKFPFENAIVGYHDQPNEQKSLQYGQYVHIAINFCQQFYSKNYSIPGFRAPCVYPCQLDDYYCNRNKNNIIAKKGSAIITGNGRSTSNVTLIGVATWMGQTEDPNNIRNLPIGIAILNSQNFLNDYACALKIRDSSDPPPYQKLCD